MKFTDKEFRAAVEKFILNASEIKLFKDLTSDDDLKLTFDLFENQSFQFIENADYYIFRR